MTNFAEMNKSELRAACKAAGIEGYPKLTVGGMRDALASHEAANNPPAEPAPADAADAADRHTGTGLKIEKDRPERNGIKRPSAGGKCRAIWDHLDTMEAPTAKAVRAVAAEKGWNPNNAVIEFYQWRKYNAA